MILTIFFNFSRCSEGDESIADFSERVSFGAYSSSQRSRMSFGLTSFEGALAKAGAEMEIVYFQKVIQSYLNNITFQLEHVA